MQIRFGVLGAARGADQVFERLASASRVSNPGLALEFERGGAVRLGFASRSRASLAEPGTGRSFYLDGEVSSIDGHATSDHGTSEADLRRLAALYDAAGEGAWELLDGSFCLVVADGGTFHIGVDLAGTRGVYWWSRDGVLVFHSHLMDLAPSYPDDLHEDSGAIGNYLAIGGYPPSATPFRQIRHLGAGQCLSLVDGRVAPRNHFDMVSSRGKVRRPKHAIVDDLLDLVAESVTMSWRNARSPIIALSGGIDSRYLAAEITRQNGPSAKTITWGEDPTRRDGDAVIASRVAATMGLENTWFEKSQRHTPETFERAIYLSSGEADCAIHYPDDHLLHEELAASHGASLFRGDQLFGSTWPRPVLTTRGAIGTVVHLSKVTGYAGLLDPGRLERMGAEQAAFVDAFRKSLRSATPQSQRMEMYYELALRRELAPYNALKNGDLEVWTPFLRRRLVDWLKDVPDDLTAGRALERAAIRRRFPELGAIPYATRSNLPDWEARWRSDPFLTAFLREWFSGPGWLDGMGTKPTVLATLDAITIQAPTEAPPVPVGRRLRRGFAVQAKKTVFGRLAAELTLERRAARSVPLYLRLSRLAVLHGMLGAIERRRGAARLILT